jgi:hypothetical protein
VGASVFDGRANPPTLYINCSASSPVNLGTTKPRELFTDALRALAILLENLAQIGLQIQMLRNQPCVQLQPFSLAQHHWWIEFELSF